MKSAARKTISSYGKYGPLETENDRVGTLDAETPEAREDDHGMAAVRKRKRGGKVEGAAPRRRLDRKARHSDAPEDRALIKNMVKSEDLKRPERARGGSVKNKKGTTVNVIIAPQGGGARPPMPMPPPGAQPPVPPPQPVMRPPMPAGPPPGSAMPPPGMMRKDGGRVHMTAGAGSGEGREEKIKEYGKNARSGEGK